MIKIVSCFWNAEQYISNCIKTLKNQLDGDFEVFLIDDMSNDNSVSIVNSLISNDSRFNLIINTEKKFKLKNLDDLIAEIEPSSYRIPVLLKKYLKQNAKIIGFNTDPGGY